MEMNKVRLRFVGDCGAVLERNERIVLPRVDHFSAGKLFLDQVSRAAERRPGRDPSPSDRADRWCLCRCPPCPGSITMRLILSPSARVSERCPSRFGFGSAGGRSATVAAHSFSFSVKPSSRLQVSPRARTFCGELFSTLAGAVLFAFATAVASEELRSVARCRYGCGGCRLGRSLLRGIDRLGVDIDHETIGIRKQESRIILRAVHIQDQAHDARFILCDANRFQQAAFDGKGFPCEARTESGLIKIKVNPIGR